MSYMALYIISVHIVNSNSRSSSNHWKLNLSAGRVEPATEERADGDDDKVLSILTANKAVKDGKWTVESTVDSCANKTDIKSNSTDTNL